MKTKKSEYINGVQKVQDIDKKFRGNYIKYIYKASEELEAPEIKNQIKKHWKILQKTLEKYNFSNVKKES